MSFVWFEQLPNIFEKKQYMKKLNSLISYENNERMKFFLRKLDRKLFLI